MKSLLEQQYAPDFQAWQTKPSKASTGKLLQTIQPEIDRGIRAHVGQTNPLIASRARQIVLQTLPRYDQSKSKLGTYIVNHLQGLKRISRQQQQILSIPERVQLDSNYLMQIETELRDKYDRDPSIGELADRSGLSPKRISYVRGFRYPIAEGSTIRHTEDGDEMPAIPTAHDTSATWQEMVYTDLDPVNQKVMEWSLGMHGQPQLSNQDIAKKLRITPGAVSQRKATIQNILNQEADLNPL